MTTEDPGRPLPQPPDPTPSAPHASSTRLAHARDLGAAAEHADVLAVLAAVRDEHDPLLPWPLSQPIEELRHACRTLPTEELRRRLRAVRQLLADRPRNRSGELARLQLTKAQLLTARALHFHWLAEQPPGAPTPATAPMVAQTRAAIDWLKAQLDQLDQEQRALAAQQAARMLWQVTGRSVLPYAEAIAEELHARQAKALEAIATDPPGYLAAAIGHPPTDQAARTRWMELAAQVERYRLDHGVADPHQALGDPPADPPTRLLYDRLRRTLLEHHATTAFRAEPGHPAPDASTSGTSDAAPTTTADQRATPATGAVPRPASSPASTA